MSAEVRELDHELNNLLCVIAGNIELLALDHADDARALARAALARAATLRVSDLSRRLAALASDPPDS